MIDYPKYHDLIQNIKQYKNAIPLNIVSIKVNISVRLKCLMKAIKAFLNCKQRIDQIRPL